MWSITQTSVITKRARIQATAKTMSQFLRSPTRQETWDMRMTRTVPASWSAETANTTSIRMKTTSYCRTPKNTDATTTCNRFHRQTLHSLSKTSRVQSPLTLRSTIQSSSRTAFQTMRTERASKWSSKMQTSNLHRLRSSKYLRTSQLALGKKLAAVRGDLGRTGTKRRARGSHRLKSRLLFKKL